MPNPNIKALAGLVVLLTAALLIGNRLDLVWAGGEGYQPHGMLELVREENGFKEYQLNDYRIFLDRDSEIELKDGREWHETIRFVTGRIVVIAPERPHSTLPQLNITVRSRIVSVSGITTLVNYSWLDLLDVSTIDGYWGSIAFEQDNLCEDENVAGVYYACTTNGFSWLGVQSFRIDTLEPYDIPIEQKINVESSKEFYDWALK